MQFAIGYQMPEEDPAEFADLVRDYREHVAEVYFPWVETPTCRADIATRRGYTDWTAQQQLERDLATLKTQGVKLDILFNANCYGNDAVSLRLANRVLSILEHLQEAVGGVEILTTTSLAVAHVVKQNFPAIEVRASVNMRIGTVDGMRYVSHLFDSFHLQREYNRDLTQIRDLREWCADHGKGLVMLTNSGCLRFCSGQIFHDNMVAHEAGIDEMKNIPDWNPHVCWNLFKDRANWAAVLHNTWIRPEDLHHYDDLFPVVKLATRMHSNPRMVLDAYTNRRFAGNLLDLCEPGFGPAFYPHMIDNTRFPADWFERTSTCSRACRSCSYCDSVFERVLVKCE